MPYNPYMYGQAYQQPQIYNNQTQMSPMQPSQMQQSMQIQDGGLVRVRSVDEARNYPVAPGNCVTAIVGNKYLCSKTVGFSPLDPEQFDMYKLEKVTDEKEEKTETPPEVYATKEEQDNVIQKIDKLTGSQDELTQQIQKLQEEVEKLKARPKKRPRVREEEEYDDE